MFLFLDISSWRSIDIEIYGLWSLCDHLLSSLLSHKNQKKSVLLISDNGLCQLPCPHHICLHIPYCRSRTVDHLCDVPAMLPLACIDTWIYKYTLFVSTTHFLVLPFIAIVCSYGHVLLAVNHMHSAEGRKKAYSTCFTHLTVVTFYYAPVVYTYLHPWPLQQRTRLWLSSTSSSHQGATLLSITQETRS